MKNLLKGIICLFLLISYTRGNAQKPPVKEPDTNRPSLFKQMPDKLSCPISDLEGLLQFETGRQVNLSLADNFFFQGIIVSRSNTDDRIKSIVVRSTNFPGASLTFSKTILEDGTTKYSGLIISFKHADAYEINIEKGQYYFIKKGFYDLVND